MLKLPWFVCLLVAAVLGLSLIHIYGQTEFIYGLTGLSKLSSGKLTLDGKDITHESIRQRSKDGMGHIDVYKRQGSYIAPQNVFNRSKYR